MNVSTTNNGHDSNHLLTLGSTHNFYYRRIIPLMVRHKFAKLSAEGVNEREKRSFCLHNLKEVFEFVLSHYLIRPLLQWRVGALYSPDFQCLFRFLTHSQLAFSFAAKLILEADQKLSTKNLR